MTQEHFRKIRLDAGLSAIKLAAVLGTTRNAIYRWENAERPIPGPIIRLMEMIHRGELPKRYFS